MGKALTPRTMTFMKNKTNGVIPITLTNTRTSFTRRIGPGWDIMTSPQIDMIDIETGLERGTHTVGAEVAAIPHTAAGVILEVVHEGGGKKAVEGAGVIQNHHIPGHQVPRVESYLHLPKKLHQRQAGSSGHDPTTHGVHPVKVQYHLTEAEAAVKVLHLTKKKKRKV